MLVLLAVAAGIYSVTSSPPKVTQAQPSDNEAVVNQFYEVAQDTDSTAPPGVTVVGQLRMQVSDPSQFANDPAAGQAEWCRPTSTSMWQQRMPIRSLTESRVPPLRRIPKSYPKKSPRLDSLLNTQIPKF